MISHDAKTTIREQKICRNVGRFPLNPAGVAEVQISRTSVHDAGGRNCLQADFDLAELTGPPPPATPR